MSQHSLHRRPSASKRDYVVWAVAFGATVLSIVAYIVTVRHGDVLTYNDAISHLQIARRTIVSTSPGLAQLGGVWLPLPHVLMMPLAWYNPWYYNGFAGSIVSMIAFVAATVLIYKITYRLADNKFAGVVAATVFACNVNVLYMQATPMTESLLFCLLAAMVYCTQQWADTRRTRYLVGASVSALFGTLTRYESWPILFCLLVAVAIIAWQQRDDRALKLQLARTQDRVIAFGVAAFAGIGGWLLWNWAIFGSPLNFQDGNYAKPSLWLTNQEPAIGHLWIAAKTYWIAMTDNLSVTVVLLAALGLVCLIPLELSNRRFTRTLPVLSLLVMVPFFITALYTGQRPLHVMQINHDLYNVRFGLIMAIPTAILIGYLTSLSKQLKPVMYSLGGVLVATIVLLNGAFLSKGDVVTLTDPTLAAKKHISVVQNETSAYFKHAYDGGLVLMETFGNERLAYAAVPSAQMIYEGSYQKWLPALHDPVGNHIRWIIARCGGGPAPDLICQTETSVQLQPYKLVYQTSDKSYRVYRLK